MRTHVLQIKINRDIPFLLHDGWEKIQQHSRFLILLWAMFYIPANVFTHIRLEPYLSQLDRISFRGDVAFVMILLNLLGYIPMIAIALLIQNEREEYNTLILDAFRHLPLFVTTSLAMIVRIILPVLGLFLPVLFLAVPLAFSGVSLTLIQWIIIPYFIFLFIWFFMRYYSSTMFYLMKGIRNFKAVRFSTGLFATNKKIMVQLLGICYLFPIIINYAALFLVEDSLVYMGISMVTGAYMYMANGIFANVFHYLEWGDERGESH